MLDYAPGAAEFPIKTSPWRAPTDSSQPPQPHRGSGMVSGPSIRPHRGANRARHFASFRAPGNGQIDATRSPVVKVFSPQVKRGVLWTVGEVDFLASPLRSLFPELHRVSKDFSLWLAGHDCVFCRMLNSAQSAGYKLRTSVTLECHGGNGLICGYSTGMSTGPQPKLGTNSTYRDFRPTMTASISRLSRRCADNRFHSDLSRPEGWGWSSGWVCHSPK